MALPLLEGMTMTAKAADEAQNIKRLQVFYTPNGMIMQNYVPAGTGTGYEITPILKPLDPFRDRMTVVTGLAHKNANALGDGAGDHGRSCGSFLTGVHPKKTEGYDIQSGISMDQVVANQFGKATQLASLELGVDAPSLVGSCDSGYSCAYTNTLSWASPTQPLPVSVNPRDVFERLFGDGDSLDPASRMAELRRNSSILDFISDDAKRMEKRLGDADKRKVDEYLTSIRDVEARIQKAEKSGVVFANMARPGGIPDNFQDHARLLIDLQVVAMQADLTRVGTLMLGREVSNRSYPEIGVPDAHHSMSHHGNDPEKLAKLTKICTYHMEQFAYFLKRLNETRHGDASLLDGTLVLEGPSLGDPNVHDHMNLPLIVAGGLVKGGRHIAVEKDTPACNLLLSMIQMLGIPQDKFGDSTGPLSSLTA
ncbi:MAG TPA: DUF1552 domain-containing protein [Rhizomicrobium sp.]|nr:DUF1552 domain-containing protein [Rhizomicrobium sp.]